MSLCALCGQAMFEGEGLCSFHLHREHHAWATGNRIMCDFVHRGIVAPASGRAADELFPEALAEVLDAALVA